MYHGSGDKEMHDDDVMGSGMEDYDPDGHNDMEDEDEDEGEMGSAGQ